MYSLPLIDKNNKMVSINVYGIERISRVDQDHDITSIIHMFKGVTQWEALRPRGEVNVLIGFNYASLHLRIKQSVGDLLMGNRFGKCLAGSHQKIKESHEAMSRYTMLLPMRKVF